MKTPKQTTGNPASARQWNALRADAFASGNLLAHNMLGILRLPTNASNGNTITGTINGSALTITLVSGTPTNPNDVKIGATGTATVANLLFFLQNPNISNTTQVAASATNTQYFSYLGVTSKDSNLIFYSNNNETDAPLTSFSLSTNISNGAYNISTLKLYIEPGTFYVGTTKVEFNGSPTGTFTAPSANPRIDIVSIGTPGAITITQGSESATPTAPTYPTNEVVVAEVYNIVGQTEIHDNDNTAGTAQGYIRRDVRPVNTIIYINDSNQIQDAIIDNSKLANAGTVPTGTVVPYAGGTATAGWLLCDGTPVSRTTYAALFAVTGTAYGSGDGSTTFNVPDLRSRIPLGAGTGKGVTGTAVGTGTPNGTALSTRVRGQWGGEETHKLTQPETPAHVHTYADDTGATGTIGHVLTNNQGNPSSQKDSSSVGGDGDHANLQPFLVLNFIIKT